MTGHNKGTGASMVLLIGFSEFVDVQKGGPQRYGQARTRQRGWGHEGKDA
jgi:hypothetical protein